MWVILIEFRRDLKVYHRSLVDQNQSSCVKNIFISLSQSHLKSLLWKSCVCLSVGNYLFSPNIQISTKYIRTKILNIFQKYKTLRNSSSQPRYLCSTCLQRLFPGKNKCHSSTCYESVSRFILRIQLKYSKSTHLKRTESSFQNLFLVNLNIENSLNPSNPI